MLATLLSSLLPLWRVLNTLSKPARPREAVWGKRAKSRVALPLDGHKQIEHSRGAREQPQSAYGAFVDCHEGLSRPHRALGLPFIVAGRACRGPRPAYEQGRVHLGSMQVV